ncbi:MAG: hypothetical protein LBL97_05770 [Prevotellaceae bacterium]|jgi:PAS domain-containing protein|nr:hypothetical protein [Prevotellaceae bacterium]
MLRSFCAVLLLGISIISSTLPLRAASLPAGEQPVRFVLILSSYTYETEWSTSLAKDIKGLLEDARSDVKVNITHADITSTSSLLADRFAMQGAFSYGRLTATHILPDLLILIGDESWMLYRIMDLRGTWNKIPVVLSGMHDQIMNDYTAYFPHRQIPDSTLIPLAASTGAFRAATVIEPDNTPQTLQLIRTLHPACKHLYFLSNGTYSDSYAKKQLQQTIHAEGDRFTLTELLYTPNRADSVRRQLENFPSESLLIVNNATPPISPSAVPVITLRDIPYTDRMPQGGFFATTTEQAALSARAALTLLDGQDAENVIASDTAYYLNRTALLNADLEGRARLLPDTVDRHVPPPFIVRHIRRISIGVLMAIVLGFILYRIVSFHFYRRNLQRLYGQYKSLYDEYQAVYENMPIGLMLFDRDGHLLQNNVAASKLLPDESLRRSIFQNSQPNHTIDWNGYSYYIMFRRIADEASNDNMLFIIVDHTEVEKMRRDKERIYNVFNFAMNRSGIGVASYNLIDQSGFATNAWYQLLDMKQADTHNFIEHSTLAPEDRKRVQQYLKKVRYGVSQPFLQNIRVMTTKGEERFLRCFIKPIDYFPNEGSVTVAELMVNMDAQIRREHELKDFMLKAQESERLKHAFVTNIRDDIRLPWHNIAALAEELTETRDFARRKELYKQLEENNTVLLNLIRQFIEASQQESLNPTMPPAV